MSWLLNVNLLLAQEALRKLRRLPGHRFLIDDVEAEATPETTSGQTTDAHLVTLAKKHNLKLATLDTTLIAQIWAFGTAENPLSR